jgi:hypothetical protein
MLVCLRHDAIACTFGVGHARSISPTVGDTLGADQNSGYIKRRKTG